MNNKIDGENSTWGMVSSCESVYELDDILRSQVDEFLSKLTKRTESGSTVAIIKEYISNSYADDMLSIKDISEHVQLSVSSSRYGLPYFLFDASDMNSPDPDLFYVNNQLKLKACEVSFGTGLPMRAQQAMLPDMIKFWQPMASGPVQIIYGGYAAKIMRRK